MTNRMQIATLVMTLVLSGRLVIVPLSGI